MGTFIAGALALLLAIGGFVWWVNRSSADEKAAVEHYIELLRDGEVADAHALLTGETRQATTVDALRTSMHTALLGGSDDLRIDALRPITDANKGCVRGVLSTGGESASITFYVRDEDGVRIHAILTNDDFAPGLHMTVEPWTCS